MLMPLIIMSVTFPLIIVFGGLLLKDLYRNRNSKALND